MNDYRALMTGTAVVCGLACASGIFPAVDWFTTRLFAGLLGLAVVLVAGHVVREVVRELLFRAEMRALDRRNLRHGHAVRSAELTRTSARP